MVLGATLLMTTALARGEGFGLGETMVQLKLEYEVSVKDHGTGRITVTFTLTDEGRLKPLNSVDLSIPSKDKHKSGGNMSDLSLSLATRKVDGKLVATVHLKKDLAERAVIRLTTSNLDGKQLPLTWYFHSIPIAEYLKNGEQTKGAPEKAAEQD
jgi:hypothetical protein